MYSVRQLRIDWHYMVKTRGFRPYKLGDFLEYLLADLVSTVHVYPDEKNRKINTEEDGRIVIYTVY